MFLKTGKLFKSPENTNIAFWTSVSRYTFILYSLYKKMTTTTCHILNNNKKMTKDDEKCPKAVSYNNIDIFFMGKLYK